MYDVPEPALAVARALCWAVLDLLESEGVDAKLSRRIALRCARGWLLIDIAGLSQKQAAHTLGITPRQARRDRVLLRRLDRNLITSRLPLPRIPVADRVSVDLVAP